MEKALAVMGLLSWLSWPAWAATLHGKVVGVSDGDTITVLGEKKSAYRVRLAGIDAPEKSQPFGDRSKHRLSDLVFGKAVDVDWHKTDKYGRLVGKVIVDGRDANLSQVQNGLAWHYKAYESEQSVSERNAYSQAEADVRSRRVGLWQDSNPMAPWDFRHGVEAVSGKGRRDAQGPCPCSGEFSCSGPRGGRYCLTSGGKKKYR